MLSNPIDKDIRQASPRGQAKWLSDRGWTRWEHGGFAEWHYGQTTPGWSGRLVEPETAIDIELAAEAQRRKRSANAVYKEIAAAAKRQRRARRGVK